MSGEETPSKSSQARLLDEPEAISSSKKRVVLKVPLFVLMHRNTFLNSPNLLDKYYRLMRCEKIFFAGQITGVEGYVESASSGLVAGINVSRVINGQDPVDFTRKTAIGALANYVANTTVNDFQPMNVNFGIIESLDEKVRKKRERYEKISARALESLENIIGSL